MRRRTLLSILMLALSHVHAFAERLFIPMDTTQANHLKAYGIVYDAIAKGGKAEWLLNYKGGSFMLNYTFAAYSMCRERGVTAAQMSESTYAGIVEKIKQNDQNCDVILLDKAPRMAVYTPSGKKPWDDAVTLALTYAQIPFDKIYVDDVLGGALSKYDWLHLHHEDFTGQFGKFWNQYKDASWYIADHDATVQLAARHGFSKVSQMQLAVVKKISTFVAQGGNLFAMCSATDTYDIALAAEGTDICDVPFDGDGMDPMAQQKLNFRNCFAFTGFNLVASKEIYEYSSIDNSLGRFNIIEMDDYFTLTPFQAKKDPVPVMLCQNHEQRIKGFMGQTTAFRNSTLKGDVIVMAECRPMHEARYIHGRHGAGSWTFYGGHDPADYQHMVNEAPTDLSQHPNSPGYRLILNNVLSISSGRKAIVPTAPASRAAYGEQEHQTSAIKIAAGSSANSLLLTVKPGMSMKIHEVLFVDAEGKEVLSQKYDAVSASVDMNDLPPGIYGIVVNGSYAGKVQKN